MRRKEWGTWGGWGRTCVGTGRGVTREDIANPSATVCLMPRLPHVGASQRLIYPHVAQDTHADSYMLWQLARRLGVVAKGLERDAAVGVCRIGGSAASAMCIALCR